MTTVAVMPRIPRMTPPTEQIAEHYRAAIRDRKLCPGDELPANRRLAIEWGVSTNTAFRAVAKLRTEGWIETRPGKPPVVVGVPKT